MTKEQPSLIHGGLKMLSPDSLLPNPSQPRRVFDDEPLLRLADSVRRHGILQPLTVRPADGAYHIIAGERRWRAARIAGLREIPCVVLDVDSQKSAEYALIENIQREDLNPFEQAAAIASLIDIYGLTQDQAAKQLSSSQSHVANKLRLLKLTQKERDAILKNNLTERHARGLLRISDPDTRLKAISHIAANKLNVSASDRYIDKLLSPKPRIFPEGNTKGCIKDLRLFGNAVSRSADILRNCGYNVETEKKISETETTFVIRITKSKQTAPT